MHCNKVLAKLDIAESRRPQSGHYEKNGIDFRVSTHPTIYGENICIRVLNKNKNYIDIENIGFNPEQIKYLKTISHFPYGMIIFAALQALARLPPYIQCWQRLTKSRKIS